MLTQQPGQYLKGFSINPCNTDREVFSGRIIDDGQGRQAGSRFFLVCRGQISDRYKQEHKRAPTKCSIDKYYNTIKKLGTGSELWKHNEEHKGCQLSGVLINECTCLRWSCLLES